MVAMPANWNAVFNDASGNKVYGVGGHENPVTTDVKTIDTFVNLALVDLARDSIKGMTRQDANEWESITINAPTFGINDEIKNRSDIADATIEWAEDQAYMPQAPKLM